MADAQAMTIPEQAVEAGLEAFLNTARTIDGIKAALTAAAPYMSGVKVKQLVWSDVCEPNENNRYTHITAYSPIGIWSIEWKAWKDYDDKTIFLDGDFIGNGGDNLEAAKAAAQADYEKRILSALELTSAREQALPSELIREYVDDYEYRGDGGDYTPTDVERAMIEDAIAGYAGYVDEVLTSSAREQALEDNIRMGIIGLLHNLRFRLETPGATIETDRKLVGQIIEIIDALKSQPAPQHPDDIAVDSFASQMKAKLTQKRAEGRSGWQNMSAQDLSDLVYEHVAKGDPIDVANLCMMLAINGQRIAAPQTGGGE